MKRVFILTSLFFAVIHCASAQSSSTASSQSRDYKLLREDEDWSSLKDQSLKQDFWDRIKYITLRKDRDDWYMTLGGEVREVWEQIGNDDWGQQPYQNGYLNERYVFFSDLHYGKHVRTFLELKSGLNSYRRGGPRPIDEKKLDFQSGYLAVESQQVVVIES